MNDFTNKFLEDSKKVISKLDIDKINYFVDQLNVFKTEKKGRIFFAGSGGGAGHASHAAADFRKLLDLECYSITDNVSELTARINDDGWETSYSNYLKS